jgi:hypothetical protein
LLCSEFRLPSEKRGSGVFGNAAAMIGRTYVKQLECPATALYFTHNLGMWI